MLDELSWYPEQEWSLDTGWYEVTDCRTTIEMSGLNAIGQRRGHFYCAVTVFQERVAFRPPNRDNASSCS